MADKKRMPVNFYQINPTIAADDSFDEVVDRIKLILTNRGDRFNEQPLTSHPYDGFQLRALHAEKISVPKWRPFISELFPDESPICSCRNITQSFILFIGYNSSIYVLVGGSGSFAIDEFVSDTFGIDIITRLIDKTDPVIKSFQNRGVTGILLGQTKHFRSERRLSDENQFGQIYKAVNAELNQKILKEIFGFKKSELKRNVSGCLAKTSFQINISIDLKKTLKVTRKLDALLTRPVNFSINSVELLNKKSDKNLIAALEEEMIRTLFTACKNNQQTDFELVNKYLDKYLSASGYQVTGGGKTNTLSFDHRPKFEEIQNKFRMKGTLVLDDLLHYKHSLLTSVLTSVDDDGTVLTKGSILSHLNGEIAFGGKTYFYIDSNWYKIRTTFIQDLNQELKLKLNEYWDDMLLPHDFNLVENEAEYNDSYINSPNTIVLDTLVPENIELCDILQYSDEAIYLFHVKRGFDNRFRNLAAQVLIAAKRLEHDMKTGLKYVGKMQTAISNAKESASFRQQRLGEQFIPSNGLPELFRGRKYKEICFCLAFVDDNDGEQRSLRDDLLSFKSNIAKYALLELMKEVSATGFTFKILQLRRQNLDSEKVA